MIAPLTLRPVAVLALIALAACGDKAEPVAPGATGASEIRVEGAAYQADLEPTANGTMLIITRAAPPMAYDEGAVAKQVATQFCAGRGKRLAPWALGQFNGNSWMFDGGCA